MKVKNPIYVIGCPRSGTTLLYTILRSASGLWSSPDESHYVWEKFLPDKRDPLFSVYLTEDDVQEGDREYLEQKYHERCYKTQWMRSFVKHSFFNRFKDWLNPLFWIFSKFIVLGKSMSSRDYRIIDKTPPNTYRVGFIAKAFPDAKFIYITRNGATNISSLIEGWRSGGRFSFKFRKFHDYNSKINIQGYDGGVWKFTNPPGWEDYLDKPLEQVCAFQWIAAHQHAQESFNKIDPKRCMQVKYEDLVANPEKVIREICMFLDIEYEGDIKRNSESLPVVSTFTKPDSNKWLKNKDLIAKVAPMIEEMQTRLGYDSVSDDSSKAQCSTLNA